MSNNSTTSTLGNAKRILLLTNHPSLDLESQVQSIQRSLTHRLNCADIFLNFILIWISLILHHNIIFWEENNTPKIFKLFDFMNLNPETFNHHIHTKYDLTSHYNKNLKWVKKIKTPLYRKSHHCRITSVHSPGSFSISRQCQAWHGPRQVEWTMFGARQCRGHVTWSRPLRSRTRVQTVPRDAGTLWKKGKETAKGREEMRRECLISKFHGRREFDRTKFIFL